MLYALYVILKEYKLTAQLISVLEKIPEERARSGNIEHHAALIGFTCIQTHAEDTERRTFEREHGSP